MSQEAFTRIALKLVSHTETSLENMRLAYRELMLRGPQNGMGATDIHIDHFIDLNVAKQTFFGTKDAFGYEFANKTIGRRVAKKLIEHLGKRGARPGDFVIDAEHEGAPGNGLTAVVLVLNDRAPRMPMLRRAIDDFMQQEPHYTAKVTVGKLGCG